MMHGDARRLYREMLEEGYDPNRGLGPVFGVMIVAAAFACVAFLLAFTAFGGFATSVLHSFGQL